MGFVQGLPLITNQVILTLVWILLLRHELSVVVGRSWLLRREALGRHLLRGTSVRVVVLLRRRAWVELVVAEYLRLATSLGRRNGLSA